MILLNHNKDMCEYTKEMLEMPPRQRILTIKLSEKINKNLIYSKKLGIEIKNKNGKYMEEMK